MNEREAATLILFGLGFVLVMMNSESRTAFIDVARGLLLSRLAVPFWAFVLTVVGAIYVARQVDLWTLDLIGATILWFTLAGFSWFMNIGGAGRTPGFVKNKVLATVKIGAFLEFFINLQVLSFVAELALQLLLLFLVLVEAVAQRDQKTQDVAKILRGVLGVIGISLISFTIYRTVADWSELDGADVARELLLPIWLTVVAAPIIYLIALYAGYESLFRLMSVFNDEQRPRLRALVGSAIELHGSLIDIEQFRGINSRDAARSRTVGQARKAVREFKLERAKKERAREDARALLVMNTDVRGTDLDGRVLDRREFAETKRALRFLASAHMGWYQNDNRPDTYRADLLQLLEDVGGLVTMPSSPGLVHSVSDDGKSWYAYRVTPSGHVLGMGAAGPPPSQWFYSGSQPPDDFPEQAPGWMADTDPQSLEWAEERTT